MEQKNALNSLNKEQIATVNSEQDSLFQLEIIQKKDSVILKAPKELEFSLPDSSAKIEPFKIKDFNEDQKVDIMLEFGACGTGGCMYGIFMKQYANYYKLVFLDYLKGPELIKEKNGFLSIQSFEEAEAYNPSKLYVTKFKFDEKKYQYFLDTNYLLINDENKESNR